MDRMTTASFLPQTHADECQLPEIEAETAIGKAQAAPSPQERLARIVQTIEQDIIPRLVRAHREPAAAMAPPPALGITNTDLQTFLPAILGPDDAGWQSLLEALLARGVPIDDVYLGLLTPAARELGRMWEEDRCAFTDVTVALGRMQRVMRTLSPQPTWS